MKSAQRAMGRMRARPKVDEARDILANVVVCHVPVVHYNFQQKVCCAYYGMLTGDQQASS